jgi:hypothetical protein
MKTGKSGRQKIINKYDKIMAKWKKQFVGGRHKHPPAQ